MSTEGPPPPKKRRIPKACKLCRTSKLRCDGGKPCTRCRTMRIECDYFHQDQDPIIQKLDQIQAQVSGFLMQQPDASTAVALLQLQQQPGQNTMSPTYSADYRPIPGGQAASPVSRTSANVPERSGGHYAYSHSLPGQRFPGQLQQIYQPPGAKRKRGDFEVTIDTTPDVIGRGLITYDDAVIYFRCFFKGCDKYVPVFDPRYDTFDSVRARSTMLFDTICTIGCRAELGPVSPKHQILANATKSSICDVLIGNVSPSMETIQALLINASYSEKGWMITSMATKMALDLDLPKAYSDVTAMILSTGTAGRDIELFRKARIWFGTFVLEHILSIDCGKKPSVTAINGMRRCRVILGHPSRTPLDLRLLSQVELNCIRALAHDRLSPSPGANLSDRELNEIVQGTRIDLNMWLNEWIDIVETYVLDEDDRDTLIVNMRIQKDWGEMTMLCKGLQGIGIDNIAIMSDEQQNLIHLARMSAQRHLSTMISNPERYLGTFRYGMDFVWAKCAFSVLLLLKLARLIPSSTNMPALVTDAKTLLGHLSKAGGANNIYFRILGLTVEKCERALMEDIGERVDRDAVPFPDAETDFQSYVPKEFTLDWSFPGLTFVWAPFDFQDMFLDFGTGF